MNFVDTFLTLLLAVILVSIALAILLGGVAICATLISIIVGTAWDMFAQAFLGKGPNWD